VRKLIIGELAPKMGLKSLSTVVDKLHGPEALGES
jgi:hypothetical protein